MEENKKDAEGALVSNDVVMEATINGVKGKFRSKGWLRWLSSNPKDKNMKVLQQLVENVEDNKLTWVNVMNFENKEVQNES